MPIVVILVVCILLLIQLSAVLCRGCVRLLVCRVLMSWLCL